MSSSLKPTQSSFNGFPSGKMRFVSVPGPFFSDLLPQIDHLGELKVTLYVLWFLEQSEGTFRYILPADLSGDEQFMRGMGRTPEEAGAALEDSLERAVVRGTLLKATVTGGDSRETFYFLNTPRGRAAIQAIQSGDWNPSPNLRQPIALNLERPNIFRLYEEHIGPLTPMIAEILREAEQTYSAQWIEEAVRIAVENNVRRWRYVDAILRSWQEEGRNDQNRGNSQKDRRRYIEGEFADYIEH